MYNFDSYNVLLSIATNIPVLLMTAFVLQGHVLRFVINGKFTQPFVMCSGVRRIRRDRR